MEAGLDYEQFWRLTLGEAAAVLRGRQKFLQDQLEARRAANFELAGLISFAVHGPGKMPKYRSLEELAKPPLQRKPTEADHAIIRAHLMRLVNAGKGGNGSKRDRSSEG